MSVDLDRVLRDAAATPTRPVDVEALHARAVRARSRARIAVGASALALVAVMGTAVLALLTDQLIVLEPGPPPGAGADPVALVGLWEVLDADDEPGAILRLDVGTVQLFRRCGGIDGEWATDGRGAFLADRGGWSGECGTDPWPDWLERAAAHRPDGDGHVLLDDTGSVLARLVPGEEPTLPPTMAQSLAEPPQVTDDTRARLAPAAPLPEGYAPADAASLLGRWIPTDAPPASQAQVRLHEDGTWTASDGCNGAAGRWRSRPEGGVLTASGGPMTLVGCENVPVASRMRQALRAGFDGEVLVLFDRQGRPLGRFQRSDCRPVPGWPSGHVPGEFASAEEAARAVPGLPPDGTLEQRGRREHQSEFAWITPAGISHRIFTEGSDEIGWWVGLVEECAGR